MAVNLKVDRFLKDTGWFHVVVAVDTTIVGDSKERVKFYINGERQTEFDGAGGGNNFPAHNYNFELVSSRDWYIGTAEFSGSVSSSCLDGYASNFYFVDGLQLGPGHFGYTDPLTNTWRPKKFKAEGTTINDGRTWSANTSGTFDGSYPVTNAFNGTFHHNLCRCRKCLAVLTSLT